MGKRKSLLIVIFTIILTLAVGMFTGCMADDGDSSNAPSSINRPDESVSSSVSENTPDTSENIENTENTENTGKKNYDMSKVVFQNKTVTYDGKSHTITAMNLPNGVSVAYENGDHIDAGTYVITAKFSGDTDNYNLIPDKTAVLTIDKVTINTDNVIFMDKTVEYDGESHGLTAQNLPSELSESDISYLCYKDGSLVDEAVEAGVYTVFLVFKPSQNYNALPNMKATLTITRTSYEEEYRRYGELGKTIDLINSEEISTVSGGKQVFKSDLFYNKIYREEIGNQNGKGTSYSEIVEALEDYSKSS